MSHNEPQRYPAGLFRSSHRIYSVEKCVLKNFANFPAKKPLCLSLFLIALQVEISSKTASICFTSKYYNKQQWRVWTRLDLERVQSKYFFKTYRSSHPKVFCKKGVVRNFTKFTGKHLCQSLYFKKVAGFRRRCYRTPLVAASERNNFIQSNAAKIRKVSLTFQLTFLLFIR